MCAPNPNQSRRRKQPPKYSFSLDRPRSSWQGHVPQRLHGGLAAPMHSCQHLDSVDSGSVSFGLAAPTRIPVIPASLQRVSECNFDDSVTLEMASVQRDLHHAPPAPLLRPPGRPRSQGMASIVRTKTASQSPVVQQLWTPVMTSLMAFSTLLQQLNHSPNMQQHLDRLLDTFAASTLVKYLTALGHFLQVCSDLRVKLSSITEIQLADVLLACRLSKSSIQGMSHVTMVIKAVRWAFRTLQIECLSVSMGALIASFHKGISSDRRESLPFSLFILMHFERRILMRECSECEIIILGTCLFLAFSGLRFSDMQRTATSSLHWNGSILRGTCWRTKTSRTGQPFGLIGRGFLSSGDFNWLFKFLSTLDSFFALHGDGMEDYLVPSCELRGARTPAQPLSYAEALYFMRTYLQLPWRNQSVKLGGDPRSYTIHGLKSTLLSWSHQLDLPAVAREAPPPTIIYKVIQ